MKSLSLIEFGDALLRTQDLDPVYVAIAKTNIPHDTKAALLVAYWCFYSLGAAAYIAEWSAKQRSSPKFWGILMQAAANELRPFRGSPTERWPRAAERRHFRGAQAVDAVRELAERYKRPADMLEFIYVPTDGARPTFGGVSARAREHRGFGEWMAFKIADMGERVLGYPVDFSDCELGIYKDPRQGAALAYVERTSSDTDPNITIQYRSEPWRYPVTDEQLKKTVDHYVKLWRGKKFKAPPMRDRLVNVQEIETIFCKYKSHRKGHYYVGKDIEEVGHGLEGWGDLAAELMKNLPSPVLRA